ncbi:MAG: hand repeat-containing protein [Verrucomicrobiales bacterium]|nr:hand repeat-containing protein [Verrucomicrobiales bacterium]
MKPIFQNKHTKGHMKKLLVAIALAAALPALTTLAQPGRGPRGGGAGAAGGGQGGPGGHRPPPSPIVAVLDANHDGVIDAQEIANAPAALATLDVDGDGSLTPAELRPPPPQGGQSGGQRGNGAHAGRGGQQQNGGPSDGPGGNHPVPPLIAVLDANGDGTIDAQEIANSSTALKALDANGDGQLTHDEFCPPPPGGGPGDQQ